MARKPDRPKHRLYADKNTALGMKLLERKMERQQQLSADRAPTEIGQGQGGDSTFASRRRQQEAANAIIRKRAQPSGQELHVQGLEPEPRSTPKGPRLRKGTR